MKKQFAFLFAILFTTQFNGWSQGGFSFQCTKDTTIDGCANPCVTLRTKIPNIRATTKDYVINPITGPDGCFRIPVNPATPGSPVVIASTSIDDRYSEVINLPFSFPFYDDAASPYSSLVASTNGYLSFDVSLTGDFSHWDMRTDGNVPNVNYDKSLILGVLHDIDLSQDDSPDRRIKFEVIGTAPHRKFVFSVYKSPLYSSSCNNLIDNTHQIVLFEGTGIIEVYVHDLQTCNSWNDGLKMIGLQNANRNKGKIPFGRGAEDPIWGSVGMNEAWRFVPAEGAPLLRSVELYDLNGNRVAVGDTVNTGNGEFAVTFPNVCPAGNTTYLVRSKYQDIINPNTFVYGVDTFRVFSNNPLRADTTTTQASCATGGVGTMFVFASGFPGASYEYSIDTGRTWQASGYYASLPPGQYNVKYRVANGNCGSSILVTIPADPNFVSGNYVINNITCNGSNNGAINVTGANGAGGFSYSINNGTFQNSGTFANLTPGNYIVRVKDQTGCARDTTIQMFEPDELTLDATPTNATCSPTPNGRITLEASGGTAPYQYSNNGTTYQPASQFTVIDSTYTITVRDANGCLKTIQQAVALTNDMQLVGRADTTICLGGEAKLNTTSNAANYAWSGSGLNNYTIASPIATPTNVGPNTYILTATLGRCTKKDTVVVITQSQIQISAGSDTSILYGQSIRLNGSATGANAYLWTSNPNDPSISSTIVANPTVTPTRTTTYTLTASNSSGCKATASITVTIIPVCVKVRNAFSPNGDGINDKWKVYEQYDCLSNISLVVFNRYGSKVFESKNYLNDWDGNFKGKPVPDGTYYAVIEFTLINGQKQTVRTDLTVIR